MTDYLYSCIEKGTKPVKVKQAAENYNDRLHRSMKAMLNNYEIALQEIPMEKRITREIFTIRQTKENASQMELFGF